MAPYQYQDYHNPYVGSITDLIRAPGEFRARAAELTGQAQARAAEVSGNAWAGAVQNIGQSVSSAVQQATDPRRKLEGMQAEAGAVNLAETKKKIAEADTLQGLIKATPKIDLGGGVMGYDIPTLTDAIAAKGGDPKLVLDHVGPVNDALQQMHAGRIATVKAGALAIQAGGNDPVFAKDFLDLVEQNHVASPQTIAQFRTMASTPEGVAKITKYFAGPTKGEIVPEGATVLDPNTNQPVFTGTPKPPTETEVALKAAGGDAAGAMNLLKPKPAGNTAEVDDQRYRSIQAAIEQKQPVTPADQAWANAYEKQKTLGVDKSAAAATERQTATIGAQVAQQKRAQDFTALQAARTDLEKNVNTPYLTAKTSANTLRDVVEAAKNGNSVAGSLQALETTMAAIRAQGLNRINTAEIGVSQNAGSLWQNIQGWFGKKVEGQPVPASIQKDMLDFASILEKAAYKKYQQGHEATNKLYGTTIPPMLTAPESSSTAPITVTPPGGPALVFPTQAQADAFKKAHGLP